MIATRNTLVEANNQHLPELLWFVTGEPSKGIRVLKVWMSDITDALLVRTDGSELDDNAEIARRFYSN